MPTPGGWIKWLLPRTLYGRSILILVASALALIPRDVRAMRASDVAAGVLPEAGTELAAERAAG